MRVYFTLVAGEVLFFTTENLIQELNAAEVSGKLPSFLESWAEWIY